MKDAVLHRRHRARRGRAGQLLPVRRPVPARPADPGRPGQVQLGRLVPGRLGVSAHTKVDDHTGELLFFNYSNDSALPALRRGRRGQPPGALRRRRPARAAAAARHGLHRALRDPQRHAAVLGAGPDRAGVHAARFHPELPSRLGVIPRRGGPATSAGSRPTRPTCCTGSTPGKKATRSSWTGSSRATPSPPRRAGRPRRRMFRFLAQDAMQTRLHRWRMNLVTGVNQEQLSDASPSSAPSTAGSADGPTGTLTLPPTSRAGSCSTGWSSTTR